MDSRGERARVFRKQAEILDAFEQLKENHHGDPKELRKKAKELRRLSEEEVGASFGASEEEQYNNLVAVYNR